MSQSKGRISEEDVEKSLDTDTLPHGRYIPYSGGSMGWFENQGVMKGERGNNYKFHTLMESEFVRSALFQRWGQATNRRDSTRVAKENSVNMMMSDENAVESAYQMESSSGILEGVTKDISLYGMRMLFTDPVELTKGEKVVIRLLGGKSDDLLLELQATVVWIKKEVVVRPVWFVGVGFLDLTADTEQFLSEFLEV